MPVKRQKSKKVKRNPVAQAVKKLRPKIVPDRRRKILAQLHKDEEGL